MADEDKPKPMSIKERMAAFQKAANEPAAPPPRPAAKPSNWTWKQKQAEAAAAVGTTPSPAPGTSQTTAPVPAREVPQVDERADRKTGMSAVDAQEAIKGQSLKERMAALQGKGFNAAPEPAPRPAPPSQPRVWKRPVVPQPEEEGGEPSTDAAPLPISLQPATGSILPSHESENPEEADATVPPEAEAVPPAETEAAEGAEEDDDEEEKERQRRAAIAARMARLGGARAGLGAPVFGRPPVKSPSPSASAPLETPSPDGQSTPAPEVAARIPLPSLTSSSSISTVEPMNSPPTETPSPAAETVRSPPLSVPKRALPPRKKSAQKQTSVDSEASLTLPPPATSDVELEASQPVVATPGEVEGEIHQTTAEAEYDTSGHDLAAQVHPTTDEADEPITETTKLDEEATLEPVEFDTKTVVVQPPPPVIEHPAENHEDLYGAEETEEEPKGTSGIHALAPTSAAQGEDDVPPVSPATALGENALSLLHDDNEEDEEDDNEVQPAPGSTAAPRAPVVPPSHIPPALRSQLDEEEEPEEDEWDTEAPPVRAAVPPPPTLASRFEDSERSETHTPLSPDAEEAKPPVPAALASASPTSPKSRPLPQVPTGPAVSSTSHIQSPPSRQNSQSQAPAMSERPARRSLPPPPPPPPAAPHAADDDDGDDDEEEGKGAVGEGYPPANRSESPAYHDYEDEEEDEAPESQEEHDEEHGQHEPQEQAETALPLRASRQSSVQHPTVKQESESVPEPEPVEDEETSRKRTIAERMARLGGVRFGVAGAPGAPPVPGPRKRGSLPPAPSSSATQAAPEPDNHLSHRVEAVEPEEDGEESEEAARTRRAAIAARLAGQGGMRFGFLPGAPPPVPATTTPRSPALHSERDGDDDIELISGPEGSMTSDDAVQVEAEDSEIEPIEKDEAYYSVSSSPAQNPPAPPPARGPPQLPPGRRPPVPAGLPPPTRKPSGPPPPVPGSALPQSSADYVMVGEMNRRASTSSKRSSTGPPPARRSLPPPPVPSASPPPPPVPHHTRPQSPPAVADLSASSQWELPSIPTAEPIEMDEGEYGEPTHSEDDTAYPAPIRSQRHSLPPPPPPPPVRSRPSSLTPAPRGRTYASADDLVALYNRVGKHVFARAAALVEYARKSIIGDGSSPGFVRTVLEQVPAAVLLPENVGDGDGAHQVEYGPVIYLQNAASVQKRASDIMPGDIVTISQAKLKGHKGLSSYSTTVDFVVGIVNEFEDKKGKLKVWQAALHANTYPTVESVSYRLDDLKSGQIKIYRVADA